MAKVFAGSLWEALLSQLQPSLNRGGMVQYENA